MAKTPAEVLRDAARYVRAGHTKRVLEDAEGNVCAMGALHKAVYGRADPRWSSQNLHDCPPRLHLLLREAHLAMLEHLHKQIGDELVNYWTVASWNDHDHTTGEDVAVAMEKAAAKVEEQV